VAADPAKRAFTSPMPRWRQLMAPIVGELAQTFRNATARTVAPITAIPRTTSRSNARAALIVSPLVATPSKQRPPRPYASKAWSTPRPEPLLLTPCACAICGEPVHKRRRRHCDACMPKARREHGLRAIEAARKALAAQAAAGNDPRRSAAVNRARGEAISEGRRRNRTWAREHPGQRDEACSSERSRQSSMVSRFGRSRQRRAYRSRPALVFAQRLRCRIRGTGKPCASSPTCRKLAPLG
jgi:hypothetical protein